MTRGRVAWVLAGLVATACGGDADRDALAVEPPVAFDTAAVRILTDSDTIPLMVEVAEAQHQRTHGLMERTALDANSGMLFLFETLQPAGSGFWMYRTRIPLDIAFLGPGDTIVAVLAMEPCESPDSKWCPVYSPGVPFLSALEVNRGFYERHGISVGDRVQLVR